MIMRRSGWEKEFWNYVSVGDGISCPVYQSCAIRERSGHCGCPMYNITINGQSLKNLCYCPAAISCMEPGEAAPPCLNSNPGFLENFKPGRIFELLRMLSENWLKAGRVKTFPVPSDLVSIMDKTCNIDVRTIPMKAYHGAIWKTDEGWVIYLNANDEPFKQRVTLFHEAFHILAHCKATPIFKKRGSEEGAFNEKLADNFALHILMPKIWFEETWATCRDPRVLAERFEVTEQAVNERLESLNLVIYPPGKPAG